MKKQARLGEHSGIVQSRVKRTPWAITVSMFGVATRANGLKACNWSMPTSSMIMNRMFGGPDAAHAGHVVPIMSVPSRRIKRSCFVSSARINARVADSSGGTFIMVLGSHSAGPGTVELLHIPPEPRTTNNAR